MGTRLLAPSNRRRKRTADLSEQQVQRGVIANLTARPAPGLWWAHIPNGGFRLKAEARVLAGLGLRKGAPDLIFIHEGRAFGLELKRIGGTPSEAQLNCLEAMTRAGASCSICFGIDQALTQLEDWKLLRGRSTASPARGT